MKDESIFYVYLHKGNDGSIFYIGMGKNNRAHSMHGRSHQWHIAVYEKGWNVEIVKGNLSKKDAYTLEKELIAFWRGQNMPLVNITAGGVGRLQKGEAFWPKGKKRPPEFGMVISMKKRGVKVPEHVAQKLRVAALGRKHTPETIQKMKERRKNGTHNSKPITVCNVTFQSMTAFANFVGVTPLAVKKWIDAGKNDRLEAAFMGVKDAA